MELNTTEISADYLVALVTIKGELDEEECSDFGGAFDDGGCMGLTEAQFYYENARCERVMLSACWPCLIPAIRHMVPRGHKVIVEVPRGRD